MSSLCAQERAGESIASGLDCARSSCFSPGRPQYCARGQKCRIKNSLRENESDKMDKNRRWIHITDVLKSLEDRWLLLHCRVREVMQSCSSYSVEDVHKPKYLF